MSSYCWKIKALTNTGKIAKGMEVEVTVNDTNAVPTENQIRDAFKVKYNIEAPSDIYSNDEKFRIIKPLPSFFYDNSTGNPAENLIDYFLSWTFRCAVYEKHENNDENVQKYSKRILHYFLKKGLKDIEIDSYKVVEVETLKQWKKIDLLCAVKLEIDGKDKWVVLAFENKMYTKLHGNQLEVYENVIDERYSNPDIVKLFFYVTNHITVPTEDNKACINSKFKALSLWEVAEESLRNASCKPVGNALFDEFWYNFV